MLKFIFTSVLVLVLARIVFRMIAPYLFGSPDKETGPKVVHKKNTKTYTDNQGEFIDYEEVK
ncbi:MAG: hypothetical protein ACJAZ3_000171 [Sphingobacteriales bacterium]|jgi:hypothetical protein